MTLTGKPSLKSLKARRRLVQVSETQLTQESLLETGARLPLVIQPVVPGLSLTNWAQQQCDRIQVQLHTHGGILLRGFHVADAADFGTFMATVSQEPMTYSYRSTPRTKVQGKVYTSTEYPADRAIPLHNEMAYAHQWPLKIAFYCQQPAQIQGETPIADSRQVFKRIPADLCRTFTEQGVLYVRNYGGGLDLPWQEVFQTEDRQAVETFCRQADIEFEWWGEDQLRTQQVCGAIATHPHTHEPVWFNQAHLFHITNSGDAQSTIKTALNQHNWPRNAYYGDGSEIPETVLASIRTAYAEETVLFPWQAGDVLLLDNMLSAHGRRPFTGPRRVLAGMADPYAAAQTLQPPANGGA